MKKVESLKTPIENHLSDFLAQTESILHNLMYRVLKQVTVSRISFQMYDFIDILEESLKQRYFILLQRTGKPLRDQHL